MTRRTAVAAPAASPDPDAMLEAIARMKLRDFVAFRNKFLRLIEETTPKPRWLDERGRPYS